MLVGLYPISAKPYHIGHHIMVQKASKECDEVVLIVSLLDRENVLGSNMAKIWKNHIIPILPENVRTVFLESSPITRVFQILKLREKDRNSAYRFRIYSDDKDILINYNNEALTKICPELLMTDVIEKVGIPREETVSITGSKMREFIKNGDFESFKEFIPNEMDSKSIFDLLSIKSTFASLA